MSRAPIECSDAGQIRDYLYVQDVAEAFLAILLSNATGPINIGSGQPTRLDELVAACANVVPGSVLVDFGRPPTTRDNPMVLLPEIDRLHTEIGWRPKVDLTSVSRHRLRGGVKATAAPSP